MRFSKFVISLFIVATPFLSFGQDIELFQQFNGRYDYTAIGNTLNLEENETGSTCDILTTSSATLNLNSDQDIIAAYLYWAGSGLGDFDIEVNDIPVSAERTFSAALGLGYSYFGAYADITDIVQVEGNTNYTISEFDLSDIIARLLSIWY